jgi:5-methylthioribose kinase
LAVCCSLCIILPYFHPSSHVGTYLNAAAYAEKFHNPALCGITNSYVFTFPFLKPDDAAGIAALGLSSYEETGTHRERKRERERERERERNPLPYPHSHRHTGSHSFLD